MFFPEDSETYEHLSRRQNIIVFFMLLFCFLLIVFMTIGMFLYSPVITIFLWLPFIPLCVSSFVVLLDVLLRIIKPSAVAKPNDVLMGVAIFFIVVALVIYFTLVLISLL